MSNRRAGELNKYIVTLSHLGFTKDDQKVQLALHEIEKELGLLVIPNENKLTKDKNKALVVAIRDVSGSVGIWEKERFDEYLRLALNEIKQKYMDVEVKYIVHHTEAKVVNEEDFSKSLSGGTIISSALKELIKHLDTDKEVIVIQFSDGDNLHSDNPRTVKLLNDEILPKVKYFKYFEANQYSRTDTILQKVFKTIKQSNFSYLEAKRTDDSLKGVRFGQELEELDIF
jgi:uncharacterized sporulation protein YeaH/YhbH (DUF444 family)